MPLGEKQALVDEVFTSVARRYDLMNDLMSGGLHRAWKDALVTAVNPPRGEQPFAVLDVAGGTGDVAFRDRARRRPRHPRHGLRHQSGHAGGRPPARRSSAALPTRSSFADGNAEALPFPTAASMPTRSRSASATCRASRRRWREAFRVLRPGGHFLCLEFSHVDVPGLDRLYDLYSFNVIPALGRTVAGDAEAYRYLAESIRQFPQPTIFADMIRSAGFRRVKFTLMTGGIVALHSGWRL